MFAGLQGVFGEIEVRGVGRGDGYEVDLGIAESVVRRGENGYRGPVLVDLLRITGNDVSKDQAASGADERSMERLAREAITDECDAEGFVIGVHGWPRVGDLVTILGAVRF